MSIEGIGIPSVAIPGIEPSRAPAPAEAPSPAEAGGEARSLWEMLTPGEREFFTRLEALGPLTYRPGSAKAPPSTAPTGQRIDVKA
jgi:hypothetical protein